MKKALLTAWLSIFILGAAGCVDTNGQIVDPREQSDSYGVFLSLKGREAVTASEGYDTVVIDAQNVSADEIEEMQARGQDVYSYLNIGSLETFRPYYEDYESLTLKPYENWENEFWIDVSDENWQRFTAVTLANDFLEKGIDGFWVDNVDVFGQFPTEEMHAGVQYMLETLMGYGQPVIINGGDQFVRAYLRENQQVDAILTGVNQETVFSGIHFQTRSLTTQKEETRQYYMEYLEQMEAEKKDIFLLEYTTDSSLAAKIDEYAAQRGWRYFISDSIELDG